MAIKVGGDTVIDNNKKGLFQSVFFSTTEPSNPQVGDCYFDASLNVFRSWTGTTWSISANKVVS